MTAVALTSFAARLADARSLPVTVSAMFAVVGVVAAGAVAWRLRRARW